MTLQEQIAKDLKTIETDLGSQSLTWDGQDYVCIPASVGELADLSGDGGFGINIDTILKVRKELFVDNVFPAEQEKVTFNSKGLRIYRVIAEPFSAFLKLILTSDDKGV
jgi:hypothetical protein